MVELLIALAVVVALGTVSVRANARYSRRERLPMQWSFTGEIGWTAPRRVALAFTPVVAALALGGSAVAILASGDPPPGQEGIGPAVILLVGLVFLAAHLFHLRLIQRTFDQAR